MGKGKRIREKGKLKLSSYFKKIEDGVELIELCGGFEEDDVQKIIVAIDGKIPVGSVKFNGDELEKLEKFLKA